MYFYIFKDAIAITQRHYPTIDSVVSQDIIL
jgi:hypothetical protein